MIRAKNKSTCTSSREVQNGSMQWTRMHTMIGQNDRQLFCKANTCLIGFNELFPVLTFFFTVTQSRDKLITDDVKLTI